MKTNIQASEWTLEYINREIKLVADELSFRLTSPQRRNELTTKLPHLVAYQTQRIQEGMDVLRREVAEIRNELRLWVLQSQK